MLPLSRESKTVELIFKHAQIELKEYKDAIKAGFKDITTERQKANGTLVLKDEGLDIFWTVSKKYVRRFKKGEGQFTEGTIRGQVLRSNIPINQGIAFVLKDRERQINRREQTKQLKSQPKGITISDKEYSYIVKVAEDLWKKVTGEEVKSKHANYQIKSKEKFVKDLNEYYPNKKSTDGYSYPLIFYKHSGGMSETPFSNDQMEEKFRKTHIGKNISDGLYVIAGYLAMGQLGVALDVSADRVNELGK